MNNETFIPATDTQHPCEDCPVNLVAYEADRHEMALRSCGRVARLLSKLRLSVAMQQLLITDDPDQKVAAVRSGNFMMRYPCREPNYSVAGSVLLAAARSCDAIEPLADITHNTED